MIKANKTNAIIEPGSTRFPHLEVLLDHRNILPRDTVKQSFYLDTEAETYKCVSLKKVVRGETERVTKETRILFKIIFVTSGTRILGGESNEAGR